MLKEIQGKKEALEEKKAETKTPEMTPETSKPSIQFGEVRMDALDV